MISKHVFMQTYQTMLFNLIIYHLIQLMKLNHYNDHRYLKQPIYHVMKALNIQLNLMIHLQQNMYNILTYLSIFLVNLTLPINIQDRQNLMQQ